LSRCTTTGLDQRQFDGLEAAEAFARVTLCKSLNTCIVAHLDQVAAAGPWTRQRQALQERISKWLSRRGIPFHAIWTAAAKANRVHLNILLNTPDAATRTALARHLNERNVLSPPRPSASRASIARHTIVRRCPHGAECSTTSARE